MRRPYTGLPVAADHAAALGRLNTLIGEHLDDGDVIPCCGQNRDLWISDDHLDQAKAADSCLDCPAYLACREHIRAHPEPSGIWGGLTPSERSKK